MIEYLILLLAVPLGKILSELTKDEREIYLNRPYFPLIIPSFFILTAVFSLISKEIFFTLFFILITLLSWARA